MVKNINSDTGHVSGKQLKQGYRMTSVQLTQRDRIVLKRIMKDKQIRMGEAIRLLIRETQIGDGNGTKA